jgi:hypothetical protein
MYVLDRITRILTRIISEDELVYDPAGDLSQDYPRYTLRLMAFIAKGVCIS